MTVDNDEIRPLLNNDQYALLARSGRGVLNDGITGAYSLTGNYGQATPVIYYSTSKDDLHYTIYDFEGNPAPVKPGISNIYALAQIHVPGNSSNVGDFAGDSLWVDRVFFLMSSVAGMSFSSVDGIPIEPTITIASYNNETESGITNQLVNSLLEEDKLVAADIYVNRVSDPKSTVNNTPMTYDPDDRGYWVLTHEVLHAVGLKHPYDDLVTARINDANELMTVMDNRAKLRFSNGRNPVLEADPKGEDAELDQIITPLSSILSAGETFIHDFNPGLIYPSTPGYLDIQVLQFLYTQNDTYHDGNTRYIFQEAEFRDKDDQGNKYKSFTQIIEDEGGGEGFIRYLEGRVVTLWDSGGIDTLEVKDDVTSDAQIDLRYGRFERDEFEALRKEFLVNDTSSNTDIADHYAKISGSSQPYKFEYVTENIGSSDAEVARTVKMLQNGLVYYSQVGANIIMNAVPDEGIANQAFENARGAGGNDTLFGNKFNNTLDGMANNDALFGYGGEDMLIGGMGDDLLYGGDGNDILRGDNGADIYHGGRGTDTMDFSHDYAQGGTGDIEVRVDELGNGQATDGWGNTDYFASIENWIKADEVQMTVVQAGNFSLQSGVGMGLGTSTTAPVYDESFTFQESKNFTIEDFTSGYFVIEELGNTFDEGPISIQVPGDLAPHYYTTLSYANFDQALTYNFGQLNFYGISSNALSVSILDDHTSFVNITGAPDLPENRDEFTDNVSIVGTDHGDTYILRENAISITPGDGWHSQLPLFSGSGNDTFFFHSDGSSTNQPTVYGGGDDIVWAEGGLGSGSVFRLIMPFGVQASDISYHIDVSSTVSVTPDYLLADGILTIAGMGQVTYKLAHGTFINGDGNSIRYHNSPNVYIQTENGVESVRATLVPLANDQDFSAMPPFVMNSTVVSGASDTTVRSFFQEAYHGTFESDTIDLGTFTAFSAFAGYDGDDVVKGSAADDTILGGAGHDVIEGAGGNDILEGGTGNDVYEFSAGEGEDTIYDLAGQNKIRFLDSLDPESFRYVGVGDDLHIETGTSKIIVQDYYKNPDSIQSIEKLDTTEFSLSELSSNAVRLADGAIYGTENDDTIVGTDNSDLIVGLDGNDTIDGLLGDDTLEGGAGNDIYVYRSGDGTDTIDDTQGVNSIRLLGGLNPFTFTYTQDLNDLKIEIDTGFVIVKNYFTETNTVHSFQLETGGEFTLADVIDDVGLKGIDITVNGSEFGDGTEYDDTFTLLNDNNIVNGFGGDDLFISSASANSIDGGLGFDTIDYSQVSIDYEYFVSFVDGIVDIFDLGGQDAGDPPIDFEDAYNVEGIITGIGDDEAFGDADNESFEMGLGFDYVDAGDGDDIVIAGTATTDLGDDNYFGGTGFDTLDYSTYANAPDMTIDVGAGTATNTRDGFDFINGFEKYVTGDGNDTFVGSLENETIVSGAGTDTVNAGDGDDIVVAGADGDDSIGVDAYHGGVGNDTLDYSQFLVDPDITINVDAGTVSSTLFGSDTISGFETYITGDGNDNITGSAAAETFYTQGGNDIVNAGGGDDTIIAGTGGGDDTYDGGFGTDTLTYTSTSQGVTVDLLAGSATGDEIGTDTISNISNVTGGDGDDTFIGDDFNNVFSGGLGSDTYRIDLTSFGQDVVIDTGLENTVIIDGIDGLDNLRVVQNGNDVVLVDNVSFGTISLSNWMIEPNVGEFLYTEGGESKTFLAEDVSAALSNGGVINRAPTAVLDDLEGSANTPVVGNVLVDNGYGVDTDIDNNLLSVVAETVTTSSGGTAVILSNGDFTYTPVVDFTGLDAFPYTVEDGNGGSAVGAVRINVLQGNAAPVANDDSISGNEDTQILGNVLVDNGNGADGDPDGDLLSVFAETVTSTNGGSVVISANGDFTYTPVADFNGTDTFTYTVEDGNGGSAVGTVTLTVAAVNDAPVANTDPVVTDEDSAVVIAVLGNDTDVDGDVLTVASVGTAANGTVSHDGTNVTYTPDANFNGSDSFTYTVSDGNGGTDTATVNVTVNPVNDAPDAMDDAAGTQEDTAVVTSVLLNDTDIDGDTLTVTAVTNGANGIVTHDGTNVTYTPNANFNGADSYTYTVSDGNGGTDTATVNVTVVSVNDFPLAVGDAVSTDEDTVVVVDVLANDSDADGDPLTITAVGTATNGTVTHDGAFVTYTPNANFNGADSFTYTISDGNGGFDTATVDVVINAVNDAPDAVVDSVTTDEDTSVVITVLGNDTDIDGDTLSITAVGVAANGTVTHDGTNVTYTPNANFNGADSFTYTISDGNGGVDTATVNVTVNPVNDAPIAADDALAGTEDNAILGNVLADNGNGADSDVDGDALSVVAGTFATTAGGSVVVSANGDFTYTPVTNFNGTDTFTYTVDDGNGGTNVGTVTLTVAAVNDGPDAVADSVTTDEDTAVVIDVRANDTDIEGDALTVTAVGTAANGTVTHDGVNVTYTPNANFNGADSFTYTISDGNGGVDTATVNVTVNAVNDNPVAVDDSATTDEDVSAVIDVLANDSDVDGDTLSIAAVTNGTNGTVTHDGSTVTYTPNAGFFGADSFSYTVTDGNGGTESATVNVTVNEVAGNVAPVAVDDVVSVNEDEVLNGNVLTNDTDADGDTLSAVPANITTSTGGTVVLNADGSFSYTPVANFHGPDTFDYTVNDGNGGSDIGTVIITVNSVNDLPAPQDDEFEMDYGTQLAGNVLADNGFGTDSDTDGDALTVASLSVISQQGVTVSIAANGDFTYVAPPNFFGFDSFTYTVDDGNGGQETAVATIQVKLPAGSTTGSGIDDTLIGTGAADVFFGFEGSDFIDGKGGNDVLYGGSLNGTDTILGGAGNDVILGEGEGDNLSGEGGNDTIYGDGFGYETFVNGDDSIYGNGGDDTIYGGGGNDYIGGNGGADTLYGEDGDDLIQAGAGADTVHGGAGMDNLQGGGDNDTLYGDAGNDTLYGQGGDDTIYGGDGNDNIFGGAGVDTIYGEAGDDVIEGNGGSDIIDAGEGHNTVYGGADDDNIIAGAGNDIIYGNGGLDTINAGDGNNTVYGGAGMDNITTGSGDDIIDGNGGADIMNAGDGNNTVTGGGDNDTITTGSGNDIILGNGGDDIINAGDGINTVTGGAGVDQITTGSGADTIEAKGGNDIVHAGAGADNIQGNGGDDFLDGGLGADTIFGGAGADIFDFNHTDAVDTISDFNLNHGDLNQGDVLDISDVIANYDPLTDTLSDWVEITDNGTDSVLSIDQDGAGTAFAMTQIAVLSGVTGLTDEDALAASGNLIT